MQAAQAKYEIVYNGKNITAEITDCVLGFTYTDKSAGEADELEILVEDSHYRWQNNWMPQKGDVITGAIYSDGKKLDCGTFTVDEISLSIDKDGGDTMTIRAIAAAITKKLRTKSSYAHENKTLREIANTIASKHGLKITGNIEAIRLDRETQYQETDLGFLLRLSQSFGYTFSVRGDQLVFTKITDLEREAGVVTIARTDLISADFKDKTNTAYTKALVSYHNPKRKKVQKHELQETNADYKRRVDSLVLNVRAENQQQAEKKAAAALHDNNRVQREGSIALTGNPLVIAGNNINLTGLYAFNGKWYVNESRHVVDKAGGYSTFAELIKVLA